MIDITKLFGDIKITSLEESIITYILNNIDSCIDDGIRGIAKKSYTSPSTIIRLSKKLGYSGFVELVYSLKLKVSTQDNRESINAIENKKIFTTNYDNAIDDFIDFIDKGNILVSAEGFSELVSKYMYMKLLVLGKKSVLSTFIDFDILFDNHVETIDSVMLISKSGEGNHCVKQIISLKYSVPRNAQRPAARRRGSRLAGDPCAQGGADRRLPGRPLRHPRVGERRDPIDARSSH